MRQFDKVISVVNLRTEYRGLRLRPASMLANGVPLCLEVLWEQGEGDKYPGEFALGGADDRSRDLLRAAGIHWISSGDVIATKEPA